MLPIPQTPAITSNCLALCIQPQEGFHQRIEVKMPGREVIMRSVAMDFHDGAVFQADERLARGGHDWRHGWFDER